MTHPPITVRESDVAPFISDPPHRRAFRVLLSPFRQPWAPDLLSIGTADVYPGQTTPYHRHHYEHEVWYVISGHGQVKVGEEYVDAYPGTVVVAEPGVDHQLVNGSPTEHFKCLVLFTPAGPEETFLPKEET